MPPSRLKGSPGTVEPDKRRPVLRLVLTPGAGASSDHSALVAVDQAVSEAGVRVSRIDFPYRLAGRKAPDRPEVLIRTVVEAADALAKELDVPMDQVAVGGRSMGGRMCSMAVSQGLEAGGLLLISYPLHPPGKPENLRIAHFLGLHLPCLFISGTRDAFAKPDELESATAHIPGVVTHAWLDGGDHGLKRKDQDVADKAAAWLRNLVAEADEGADRRAGR